MSPQEFPEAYRKAWIKRDAAALAALFAEDATMVSLSGEWLEGRRDITRAHGAMLRGPFADSRMVMGRIEARMAGTAAIVHARIIVMGARAGEGAQADKRSTMLTVVMEPVNGEWSAVSAVFSELR